MNEYVCPSCGTSLNYTKKDLQWTEEWIGVTGECSNKEVCGVIKVNMLVRKSMEDDD